MSAIVLDAGALMAVDRDDRSMLSQLRLAHARGIELRTHAFVVAQVWRDARGRQVNLAGLLKAVAVLPVDDRLGRACGELLSRVASNDPIDAAVVLIARDGDEIITSDPVDLEHLVRTARLRVRVVTP